MDFDDLDELSQVPSRTLKFAPKGSKFKPQPKPKPDPQEAIAKPESKDSGKPEPQNVNISKNMEDEEDIKNRIGLTPNVKTTISNGSMKMEIDANAEAGDPMEVERGEEDEEVEDMIVREIDVFFTPSIDADTLLYVMQYPLRPCWRPYELDDRCEEVRVKPASGQMEIDLAIDESVNWDTGVANRMKMTKQTLSRVWTPACATCNAVGVLIDNKLHLNPIHEVVQFRPSLNHLGTGGLKKNNVTYDAEVTVKLEDSNEGKPVGALKKQNKHMELANELKSNAEEHWIPLKYHSSKSDLSSSYLQKMMAQESSQIGFAMSPYDYMDSLCPGVSSNNSQAKGPSRRFLLALPLEERVKKLLLEGPPVLRFNVLKHFAPDDSVEDVLTVLQKYGQLVQGLWAPKSSLLFSNVNEMIKVLARDFVLLLFSKNVLVSSSQLNVPMKLREEMKGFLNVFAVERPSLKDWKFKEPTDAQFIKSHYDIVESQEKIWQATEKAIDDRLNRAGKGGAGVRNAQTKSAINQSQAKSLHSDKGATKGGAHPKTTITDETREALRKALPKVFQNHKVCSFQLICQGLRDFALSVSAFPKAGSRVALAAAFAVDAPPAELQEVISEVATNIHGFYVLKSSPDHPEFDPLRRVVIDLLLARGPNAKLKKAEVFEAARLALKREVTNNEYNKVMTDFCESKGSAWMLKSGDGKPS